MGLVLVIGPSSPGSCPPTILNRITCDLASPCSVKGDTSCNVQHKLGDFSLKIQLKELK